MKKWGLRDLTTYLRIFGDSMRGTERFIGSSTVSTPWMAAFLYESEWDPATPRANFNKHGADFERVTEVFRDPLTLTIPCPDSGR